MAQGLVRHMVTHSDAVSNPSAHTVPQLWLPPRAFSRTKCVGGTMCGRKASGAGRGGVVPTLAITEATDLHTVASGPWWMEPNWGVL